MEDVFPTQPFLTFVPSLGDIWLAYEPVRVAWCRRKGYDRHQTPLLRVYWCVVCFDSLLITLYRFSSISNRTATELPCVPSTTSRPFVSCSASFRSSPLVSVRPPPCLPTHLIFHTLASSFGQSVHVCARMCVCLYVCSEAGLPSLSMSFPSA